MVVAVSGKNLNNAVGKVKKRDVKGTAAEVEDEDFLILVFLIKTVGKSGCRRLVNDTLDIEACNLAGVFGCLTLGIVEVCRNGNDGVGYFLTEVLLGVSLHLREDHGADLLRRVIGALNLHNGTTVSAGLDLVRNGLHLGLDLVKLATHETLDGEYRVHGVSDSLVLCCLTDNAVAVSAETHDRRSGAIALSVNDNGRLAALKDSHSRVGSAEVDTKNLSHSSCSFPMQSRLARSTCLFAFYLFRARIDGIRICGVSSLRFCLFPLCRVYIHNLSVYMVDFI